MSKRTVLSRPRTRIYDSNYNMSENYYRPALNRLDQKYNPLARALASPPLASVAQDVFSRHEEAFANENLGASRRRAEKHITESNLFDSRGARISQRALDLVQNDIDEETASTLKRIRANKKVSAVEDVDFESTVNNLNSQRLLDRSEKTLRSVGLNENSRRALDEDVSIKRRSLKVTFDGEGRDSNDLVKWRPLQRQTDAESAAIQRAKQTRDRILNIEDEMAAAAEKQEARERRAARFKALVAESSEETEAAQTAIKAISIRSRREQATVEN